MIEPRRTSTIPTPFGYKPTSTAASCGCGGTCSGGCDGFRDDRQRENACCNVEPLVEITNFSSVPDVCPPGTIPSIIREARDNPLFSSVFACFDDNVLRDYFCSMAQYAVPGCGDIPVLLAAAHFYTLLAQNQRLGTMAMVNQAENGKPLELVAIAAGNMKDFTHWHLSFYGIQYQNMYQKPATAYLGMAWGL
jgi:hypothetical protein